MMYMKLDVSSAPEVVEKDYDDFHMTQNALLKLAALQFQGTKGSCLGRLFGNDAEVSGGNTVRAMAFLKPTGLGHREPFCWLPKMKPAV